MSRWTDEAMQTLTSMHSAGHTASEIARALGGLSRNAVCGKIDRLGLSAKGPRRERVKESKSRRKKPRKHLPGCTVMAKIIADEIKASAPIIVAPPPYVPGEPIGLMDLTRSSCRYPVGKAPDGQSFLFCGLPVKGDGFSNCDHHHRLCYEPRGAKKRVHVMNYRPPGMCKSKYHSPRPSKYLLEEV